MTLTCLDCGWSGHYEEALIDARVSEEELYSEITMLHRFCSDCDEQNFEEDDPDEGLEPWNDPTPPG